MQTITPLTVADFKGSTIVIGKVEIDTTGIDIDVGNAAIDRANIDDNNTYTIVDKNNPANETGKITSVDFWAHSNMTGVVVAIFTVVSGDNLTARDSQVIGNVTAGSKQTFTVDLDVVAGDYLGVYCATGVFKRTLASGARLYRSGDQTTCVNAGFFPQDKTFSLYGSGVAYQTLPDVTDFSLNTNIEDEVSRFCAYAFSITCLNTDKRYFSWNTASAYYNWLKQGRRIKIYAGIKSSGTDYYYQWIIGRVDNYSLQTVAGEEICTITGRDFMRTVLDYKLYSPNTYWGTTQTFNTVASQADYSMNATCKGIYIAYLDNISPYDGSHLAPIYVDSDFGYLESTNKFSFLAAKIPSYNGTNNLVVYYYQTQNIETVVGHILYLAGIFATTGARDTWLANASYVTPTGIQIDRVSFDTGTSAFEAIRLLAEVAQYRFYFDYAGNPVFKPKASIGTAVDTFSDDCITNQEAGEDVEEVYNHIIVMGETRETLG